MFVICVFNRIVLERQQVMAHRHIPIETWLEALGMKEYSSLFTQYDGVEVGVAKCVTTLYIDDIFLFFRYCRN